MDREHTASARGQAGIGVPTSKIRRGGYMVAIARALTPTEVITAWEARPDFVKVVWCAQNCSERYILALSLLGFLKAGREHLAARKAKAMIPEEE
jgi:hypothetical protein